MAWQTTQRALAAAVVLALAGCDDAALEPRDAPGDVDEGVATVPGVEGNGVLLNSFRLNSFRLNSFRLNSFRLNGDPGTDDFIQIIDAHVKGGHDIKRAWLQGSELVVETNKHKKIGGKQLKHTRVTFLVSEDGEETVREIKIKDVKPLHKGSDILLYDIDLREGEHGKWEPLCVDSGGDAVDAVLLADVWDPETGAKILPRPADVVTVPCVDAALGKCVTWGYRPWAKKSGEPLADYHQACTRMVRADYCGDGVSHTQEGTLIHVLDQIGVELLDELVAFVVEAEWGPDGAVCLNPENTRLPDQDIECELPTCAGDFASGGLIQSGKVEEVL